MLVKLSEIYTERSADLSKAADHVRGIEAKEAEAAKARESEFEKSFDEIKEDWTTNMPAYQRREKDDDWNTAVDNRWTEAQKLAKGFSSLSPKEQIKAAAWVQAGPALANQNVELIKEIEKLNARIAKLNGGAPKLGGGGEETTTGKQKGGEQTLDDLVNSIAEKTGLRRV